MKIDKLNEIKNPVIVDFHILYDIKNVKAGAINGFPDKSGSMIRLQGCVLMSFRSVCDKPDCANPL